MRLRRGVGQVLGGILLAMLLVPGLVAWISALLDRGPGGSTRFSAFPLALALFDPFVWTCARNSLLVASATAGLSVPIGVGLASVAGPGRFRGRGPLWAMTLAPLAAGPLLIALSLASAFGGQDSWDWLAGRSVLGTSAEVAVRWIAFLWTELAVGVPLVALATLAGLRRVEPTWSEAALAVGASRRQAWRDVVWPNLRPGVARASAMVFTLALIEPAAPMVLGLGRTLGVQIVYAATRLDQPTRSSTLALLAVLIAFLGGVAICRWGGTSRFGVGSPVAATMPAASTRSAWFSRLLLAAWCCATVGPVGFWLWRVLKASRHASTGSNPIAGWLMDPEMQTWVANSAMTAGIAVLVDLIILRALSHRRPGSGGRSIRLACWVFQAVPPLALGAFALAIPWMVLGLADSLTGPLVPGLRRLALELSPGRSPGFLLILVLAAGQLPMLAQVAMLARGRIRPSRVDASRLMGETDRRAARTGEAGFLGVVPSAPAFLAFASAATSLAPALLLSPFSERRTLAPAILGLIVQDGPVAPRSFGLIVVVLGLNLAGLAVAKVGTMGDHPDGERRRIS
jgi:ABC-type Fe3+ transport system permease subunit